MDEIFGRVTAILFAAAVFMWMPLLYMSERAKSAEQMYFLTMEMYQQFYKEISAASGIYEVHMYREQKDIVLEQGDYSYESIFFDEKDMLAELEKNRVYEFERGDYLKVAIIKKKGWMDFVGNRDSSVNVLYGGTVRYEDF